ncbi:hypothetical protein NSQ20_12385 [Paenibacillus sp. FSL K6-1122]|uniref:hypothetical protein n=1 Tax=Paenibacillus sp. FSL K6-1122 TaxID=2954512 RepID=UPI0030ED3841
MKQYDEETLDYFRIEMMNAEDFALLGYDAVLHKSYHDSNPSPDIVAQEAKKLGFDTFEIAYITKTIKRYAID